MDRRDGSSTPQGALQVQTGPLEIERAPIQAVDLVQSQDKMLGSKEGRPPSLLLNPGGLATLAASPHRLRRSSIGQIKRREWGGGGRQIS